MIRYTVTHTHGEGITQFNFETAVDIFANQFYGDDEQLERLAKALNINYEPHKGERLEVCLADMECVYLDAFKIAEIIG